MGARVYYLDWGRLRERVHAPWPTRSLLWLLQYKNGEVEGVPTPVGVLPKREELNLEGLDEQALADLDTILTIDVPRWQQEMGFREKHLAQFDGLPEEIWEAHRRVAQALDNA